MRIARKFRTCAPGNRIKASASYVTIGVGKAILELSNVDPVYISELHRAGSYMRPSCPGFILMVISQRAGFPGRSWCCYESGPGSGAVSRKLGLCPIANPIRRADFVVFRQQARFFTPIHNETFAGSEQMPAKLETI